MKVNPKRLALDIDTTEGGTYHDADDGHLFVLVVHEFCLTAMFVLLSTMSFAKQLLSSEMFRCVVSLFFFLFIDFSY